MEVSVFQGAGRELIIRKHLLACCELCNLRSNLSLDKCQPENQIQMLTAGKEGEQVAVAWEEISIDMHPYIYIFYIQTRCVYVVPSASSRNGKLIGLSYVSLR